MLLPNSKLDRREELEELEHELTRRQSQSRNSEIKRIKDIHVQEFVGQEQAWRDKVEQLQNKVLIWRISRTFTCNLPLAWFVSFYNEFVPPTRGIISHASDVYP